MKQRTLVHMIFGVDNISLRTVNRTRKSPHRFYIQKHSLEELEHRSWIIVHDISSFAVLHRGLLTGTIEIEFSWLEKIGDDLSGYQETIILPYEKIKECMRESQQGGPVTWKTFSMVPREQPTLVFKSRKNLHAVLENALVRRKLVRFLRDQFRWPYSERVEFYDDFMPYSFIFKEIRGGEPVMTGGLILHGQEDLEHAYYSMHT